MSVEAPQRKVDQLPWSYEKIHAGTELEALYQNNPDRFYNDTRPTFGLAHEKPEHRIMLMLKAQGFSNKEIATITGYEQAHVSIILRQPWARQRLLDLINKEGKNAISEVIRGECANSVFTLVELRDDAESETVRLGAANALIDRYLGKPTQHIESRNETTVTHKDVSRLDDEIAATQREIERLQGVQGSAKVEVTQ